MARRSRAEQILEAALDEAEAAGWERLRLHAVAARLGLPMAEIRRHYRDLDAIADAWLARADAAMLTRRDAPGFMRLGVPDRLIALIESWLGALAGHRRVTRQIFAAKLYPGHPHHNLKFVTWTSRTVQWIRDAAGLDAGGRRRQVEEIGLSAIFLATLALWVRDASTGQERTRRFLARRLEHADRLMALVYPSRARPAAQEDERA